MMINQLDQKILQAYSNADFILFPLNGKIPPRGFHWGKAQYNPFPLVADFPYGNFGVKLDEMDLVIDIDPRNFPKDRHIQEEFNKMVGFKLIGSSFTVRTGSGGAHVYFKKPADFNCKGALTEFPGIEFKSRGQYVVGAGSVHPDTKNLYTVFNGNPGEIKDAPETLLNLIKRSAPVARPQGPVNYTVDDQTKSRFITFLKTAPIAVEGQRGDNTTFSVAAVAHDFGLHPDIALNLMAEYYNPKCEPPWSAGELKIKVYNAYRYSGELAGALSSQNQFPAAIPVQTAADFHTTDKGMIKNTVYNTVTAFNVDMPQTLALNVWTEDIIFLKPAPWHDQNETIPYWDDAQTALFKYYLGKERYFEPRTQQIEEALVTVGRQCKFHPIKRELESYLWDGVPRIKSWLINFMGAEDNVYVRNVGLKTLVAAIKRLYEPGCQFDYVMVLEGPQGIGKSTAIQILGGEYYGDIDLNLHDKETIEAMRRYWIIEASEMETHRKQESTAMRAFLSRKVDTFRVPYAKRAKSFPRQSIFIGTINPEQAEDVGWLKDTTGNRRYWPIRCGVIDRDGLRKVRNQLWAEALMYYREGAPIFLEDTRLEELAVKEQNKRMGADAWFDRIQEWLAIGPGAHKNVVTLSTIFCDCLGGRFAMITRVEQRRVADIMRALEWEKGVFHSTDLKATVRGYRRPPQKGEK